VGFLSHFPFIFLSFPLFSCPLSLLLLFYLVFVNSFKVDRKEIEKMFKTVMKGNETGLITGEQFGAFIKSLGIQEDFIAQLLFGIFSILSIISKISTFLYTLFLIIYFITSCILYYYNFMYNIYVLLIKLYFSFSPTNITNFYLK
jgi:hypothetical protein